MEYSKMSPQNKRVKFEWIMNTDASLKLTNRIGVVFYKHTYLPIRDI